MSGDHDDRYYTQDEIDDKLSIPVTIDKITADEISEGKDLNDYYSSEFKTYKCPSNKTAVSLLNCPTKWAFNLTVFPTANGSSDYIGCAQLLQEYRNDNTRKIFQRTLYNDIWSEWRELGGRAHQWFSSGDNLNAVTDTNTTYISANASMSATLLNTPFTNAGFRLEVNKTGGAGSNNDPIEQIVTQNDSSGIYLQYRRYKASSSSDWTDWARIPSKYPNGLYVSSSSWDPTQTILSDNESCLITIAGTVMSEISGYGRTGIGVLTRVSSTIYFVRLTNTTVTEDLEFVMRYDAGQGWTVVKAYEPPKYSNGIYVKSTSWKPTSLSLAVGESCFIEFDSYALNALVGINDVASGIINFAGGNVYWIVLFTVANFGAPTQHLIRYSTVTNTFEKINSFGFPKYPNGVFVTSTDWVPTRLNMTQGDVFSIFLQGSVMAVVTNGKTASTFSGTVAMKGTGIYDFVGQLGAGEKMLTGRYTSDSWTWYEYSGTQI